MIYTANLDRGVTPVCAGACVLFNHPLCWACMLYRCGPLQALQSQMCVMGWLKCVSDVLQGHRIVEWIVVGL